MRAQSASALSQPAPQLLMGEIVVGLECVRVCVSWRSCRAVVQQLQQAAGPVGSCRRRAVGRCAVAVSRPVILQRSIVGVCEK